jgi:hypothetical protein
MRVKFQIIVTDLDTGEEITKRCRDFRPRVVLVERMS